GGDDGDLPDLVLEDLGAGTLGAQEAELDVLPRKGIPVVELEPFPQLELVGLAVRAHCPRLGQAWRQMVAGHGLHKRVVDRVEDPERREDADDGLARIEPNGRKRHVPGPTALAFGFGLGRRIVDEAADQDRAEEDQAGHGDSPGALHVSLPPPIRSGNGVRQWSRCGCDRYGSLSRTETKAPFLT